MKKAVFFDIDGTLLGRDRDQTMQVKQAIAMLQSNGILTAIATGRGPHTIQPLLKDLNMSSYVCFNGQYVVYGNKIISRHFLDAGSLQPLTREVHSHGHKIIYLNEAGIKMEQQNNGGLEALIKKQSENPLEDNSSVYQAIVFAKKEDDDYLNQFKNQYVFVRWGNKALDIIPLGRSKIDGIKSIIQASNIDMKDVYAFGDGLNDIEMIQEVGVGVAMGNAPDLVKKHADYVTSDVDNGGIVKGLKKVGLLPEDF